MRPSKIVCIGRNYVEHARELGNDVPKEPLFFLKPPSSLVETGKPIRLPKQSKQVEHEGEIGLVIGKTLKNASPKEAQAGIESVVAANDVTARDLQKIDSQWTRAKGFDTFCPLGPPAKPPADLSKLSVVTRVNGVERQRGTASEMAFPIAELLSYVSQHMTLEPGDVVLTGTPHGIGILKPGDVVEVEIPGFSSVKNPVQSESEGLS